MAEARGDVGRCALTRHRERVADAVQILLAAASFGAFAALAQDVVAVESSEAGPFARGQVLHQFVPCDPTVGQGGSSKAKSGERENSTHDEV